MLMLLAGTIFSQVKVYEGKETIPTYQRADDVLSPVFYTGRSVQGAAGKIYPYPAQSNLGDELADQTYDMVYLENEYIRVTILPDFGGKIYRAVDKTNGYEIIHSNTTIKPDLIGTLGAWISGGIEWCFPHHHRPSTLMPADYLIQKNEDGSATVWVGETERTLRLRGIIGITVRPGCSYFEVEYRLNNTTDITKTFLFWANASMTANENYRTFWPPSQQIAADHNNSSFTHWPVSSGKYSRADYTAGVDLTWWKNHPTPVSFFYWQAKEGFIGGYDYGASAGTVHVGNVHESKTSKLFQFGPGTSGQAYRRKLTDDGKAYVELMTGTFSNNQPDYTWFAPHSVKDATNYYYGIRDIEIAKNANIDAAVTLQMRDEKTVFYGINTTRAIKDARISLKYGEEEIVSETVDIDPANPYKANYKGKNEIDEYQLYIQLSDEKGNELISYRPVKRNIPDLPEEQERVKPPSEIESVEDLYLAGRFVEQFARPFHNPGDYYRAALKKSPDDYRVNLAFGMSLVRQWRYEEALVHLQRAADKLKVKYYQPREGELFYYMGLAQKALGRTEEAYRNLYQSTWYYEWHSAGFYQLALMEGIKGNLGKSLEFAGNAYSTNNNDGRIAILYAAMLRKNGMEQKALALIDKFITFDPINFAAYYEKERIEGKDLLSTYRDFMQDPDNNYLDIAVHYVNAGLYADAIHLLTSLESPDNPLVYYYLAWLYSRTNRPAKSNEMLSVAAGISTDYCFPYRKESERVLRYAAETDADNAVAFYLLGNLLYDNRKDDALAAWTKAAEIDPDFSMIWRNLAFAAFHHQKDVNKAIDYLHKALEGDKNQPAWYAELATYYDESDRDYRECLALLEENIDVVKIDAAAPKEVVKLLNLKGEYDRAIEMLETHHFRTWEGGRIIHSYYVDAHMLRALDRMETGSYDAAMEDLEAALLYPANLEVGKTNDDGRAAMVWYNMGQVFDKLGKKKDAKTHYQKAAKSNNSSSDLKYYQALSLLELGEPNKAREMFNELIDRGNRLIERGADASGIGVEEARDANQILSEAYYLQALGNRGLGNEDAAVALFGKSLDAYQNNLWAKIMLEND
jgi:tetratricopeptide (TPR) repeat protein